MTDAEKNRALCELLGWEPRHEWQLSNDGGKSHCASTIDSDCWSSKWHLQTYLNEQKASGLHFYDDMEVVPYDLWPDPYHDTALAVRALEEWCNKKRKVCLHRFFPLGECRSKLHRIIFEDSEQGASSIDLPAAIVDAILADAGITKGDAT